MPNLTTMCDFEKAVLNAIEQVFPDATMMGCKYHLSSALNKHMADCGLKNFYCQNLLFNQFIHKFLALIYVPESDVISLFDQHIEDYVSKMVDPQSGDPEWIKMSAKLLEFLNYLNFWVGKLKFNLNPDKRLRRPPVFPISLWNQYEAIQEKSCPTTNNQLESFNRTFNAQVNYIIYIF